VAYDIRDVTTLEGTNADVFAASPRSGSFLTAVVDDISPDGVPRIVISGESVTRPAATTMQFPTAAAASEALLGRSVLVLLGPADLPIIVGVISRHLWEERGDPGASELRTILPPGQPVQVEADKRRIDLEATDEIRLTCGKSALVMRRDGTVVVRGVKIVSRATGTHRIMGATVGIN
jgi:hypothetical protein